MKDRLADVVKKLKIKDHKIVETFKGNQLAGKRYTPLFPYYESMAE
jgi:isoleucyl-tRNA synthetase